MASRLVSFFITLTTCLTLLGHLAAQVPDVSRTITVRDGLPQSYVSSVFQDRNGFLWISTLNGLGRYDGRGFTNYRHTSSDTSGLSGNIIVRLFDAGNDDLLLCYMDGKMDMLNTVTTKVVHLWKSKGFELPLSETRYFRSLIRNSQGIWWMMASDGGVYRIDLPRMTVRHLSLADLKLQEPVAGIAFIEGRLALLTQTYLYVCDSTDQIIKKISYPFKSIQVFKELTNIHSPDVRANGDWIITDAGGIKIWNPATGFFNQVSLPRVHGPGKLIAGFDHDDNYFFEYNHGIYILLKNDSLIRWSPANPAAKCILTYIYTDRSGVLWVGTNGYGLRQYNLAKTSLQGYKNNNSFVSDILGHYHVSPAQVGRSFLGKSVPYASRSATWKDTVWIADINNKGIDPQLAFFTNDRLAVRTFRDADAAARKEMRGIQFLTFTKEGILWGIDQHYRLLKFNVQKLYFQSFPPIELDSGEEINGMVPDGESAFYISTNKSLVRCDIVKGYTEKLVSLLPSKDLLSISNDPDNKDILWIGTLSDGLIRMDKITKNTQVFSIATGLPNNTIYCILPGNDGLFWCSSNKGIFAFNPKNQTVRSFTSRDGLTDDEFNRYFYMVLPDGNLAFGGPLGYTLVNPSKLVTDEFDPPVVLTGLNVINWSPLSYPLSAVTELALRYDQNFITAEFAAMQFDLPEKIQYRYMLNGFDKNWVMIGNDNKAFYTGLPPGSYTLLLNASNTSGKWSSYVRRLKITISPPFWKTWWFYTVIAVLTGMAIYLFLSVRIRSVKRAHAQKLQFEREAVKLHAMALRARMNPHFIFNCLNSIKALIQEKQDKKAISYLTTFVTLIRKQLNNADNEISLQDELETCRLYLELEAMRFDGRIGWQIHVEDELLGQALVPPLTLQPIVENAVVHGLLPREEGGQVRIRVYRDGSFVLCEIEDNGIGRAAAAEYRQKSSRLHQSKGLHLLEERITVHNRLNEGASSLHTTDVVGPDGNPLGTRVIIKFNTEL
ncbi:MAG TPA: histidine kinase [Puia sp.]|jgi:ligand-binding sensor domain-containing protein